MQNYGLSPQKISKFDVHLVPFCYVSRRKRDHKCCTLSILLFWLVYNDFLGKEKVKGGSVYHIQTWFFLSSFYATQNYVLLWSLMQKCLDLCFPPFRFLSPEIMFMFLFKIILGLRWKGFKRKKMKQVIQRTNYYCRR